MALKRLVKSLFNAEELFNGEGPLPCRPTKDPDGTQEQRRISALVGMRENVSEKHRRPLAPQAGSAHFMRFAIEN